MSRLLIVFFAGALLIPAAVFGGSVLLESGGPPADCRDRDAWLRDSTTRFAAAEGAAGSVNRYTDSDSKLQGVSDSYAKAATEQTASNPPGSDAASNALIAQYFQWLSENWKGWESQPYISIHSDLDLKTQSTQLQDALQSSKDHCA